MDMQLGINASANRESETANNIQTIFYQGILCSQAQMTKYIGTQAIHATNGQLMACEGINHLKPINVLINPFIGTEIKDVDTHPFNSVFSYLNPVNLLATFVTKLTNWYQGIHVYDQLEQRSGSNDLDKTNLNTYGLNFSQISIGQETDIASHYEKYLAWKKQCSREKNNHLVLYGVSRGAATTFNAMARYKYPEVKLVVLEGCFNKLSDVLHNKYLSPLSSVYNLGLTLFTRYHNDGPQPEKSVADFPANVPVVFITSKKDTFVPTASTIKLANDLAARGKNDVYLLQLEKASHPNYMFDDKGDHDHYESFIHAIYEKYHLPYDEKLAAKGRELLKSATLYLQPTQQYSEEHEQQANTNYRNAYRAIH